MPKFTMRHLFRESYRIAFNSDPGMEKVLNCRAIDELCLIRNLLVHKGGLVDKKFREDCEKATSLPHSTPENTARLTEWSKKPDLYKFPFDGEFVMSMIDPVIDAGRDLVETVSLWLQSHKPTPLTP